MDTLRPCSAKILLCLRLTDVQHKVVQGQVGVWLIKSMCSKEAALCNAIKQVYRPPLATFFFPAFHHMTKCPLSGQSITLYPLTAPGLRLWGRGWGERVRKVKTGLLKVIMAVVDYRVSSPSLFLAGGQRATECMLISCGREKGGKMAGQDHMAWALGRKATWSNSYWATAQTPLTLPLNRWRQEGAEWYDWSLKLCFHQLFVSAFTLQSVHMWLFLN